MLSVSDAKAVRAALEAAGLSDFPDRAADASQAVCGGPQTASRAAGLLRAQHDLSTASLMERANRFSFDAVESSSVAASASYERARANSARSLGVIVVTDAGRVTGVGRKFLPSMPASIAAERAAVTLCGAATSQGNAA